MFLLICGASNMNVLSKGIVNLYDFRIKIIDMQNVFMAAFTAGAGSG